MNQDAFRSLLGSKPSAPSSSAPRPSGVLGGAAPKRGYGGGSKALDLKDIATAKRALPELTKPARTAADPAFVPRKTATKKTGKYVDRAEMRRQGLENEFQPVEKLLEDFERRAEENGEDPAQVEEQRAYLGGDAQHSILIKGLDYTLLAARKAELEAQAAAAHDDDLEAALDAGGELAPASESVQAGAPRKKTRDEIVAELKRKRMGERGGDEEEDDLMGVKKSRGEAPVEQKAPALPFKFKSIVKRPEAEPEGKIRKKKKKKVVPVEAVAMPTGGLGGEQGEPAAGPSASTSDTASRPKEQAPNAVAATTAPAPRPDAPIPPPDEDDDDDGDIFGGVGDYEVHIDSDDEEGGESKKPAPPLPESAEAGPSRPRRNWFGDAEPSPSPEPAQPAAPPARTTLSRSPSPDPQQTTRLQPLSSHGPSARELLAAADEADRLAKRRANKAKWRAKQGLPAQAGQEDEDEDERLARKPDDKEQKKKLHKDTHRLSTYMANKKRKEGG